MRSLLEVLTKRTLPLPPLCVQSVEDEDGKFVLLRLKHKLGATGATTMRYVWNADGTIGVTMVRSLRVPVHVHWEGWMVREGQGELGEGGGGWHSV